MSVRAVARRYAEAMADVAMERNQVDEIDNELRAFAGMIEAGSELYDLFASPIISQDDKRRVLEALIARTRPGEATANLLRTLLGHYRLHHLDAVYEQFRRQINRRKGIVEAFVTTAAEIGPVEREILDRNLREMTGRSIQIQFKTDPSLIGGVVTRIESVVYDGSISTQLREIKQRLKSGGV
ncbi:MAG: ATP synthase F1 subunit delta [Blastocatellia bacterium]|nr:ATP synthase F1 subunit delta [Blastocatellia bacterium]